MHCRRFRTPISHVAVGNVAGDCIIHHRVIFAYCAYDHSYHISMQEVIQRGAQPAPFLFIFLKGEYHESLH